MKLVTTMAAVAALVLAPSATAEPYTTQGGGTVEFSNAGVVTAADGLVKPLQDDRAKLCKVAGVKHRRRNRGPAHAHTSAKRRHGRAGKRHAGHGNSGNGDDRALALAVTRTTKFLSQGRGRRGLRMLAHGPDGRTEQAAMNAAAAAAIANQPAAALAALLRAHQLKPDDALPLLDAAPLLSRAHRAQDALVFLRAAHARRLAGSGPFGVSHQAQLDDAEGYAYLQLGNWSSAARWLQKAVRSSPQLSGAERDLGVARLCQGKTKQAAQEIFLSAHRQHFSGKQVVIHKPPPLPPPPPGSTQPPASQQPTTVRPASLEIFDLSHGVGPTVPTFLIPADPQQAADLAESYNERESYWVGQERSLFQATPTGALLQEEQRMNPVTRARTKAIVAAAFDAESDPDIVPLWTRASQLSDQLDQWAAEARNGIYGFACSDALFAQWQATLKGFQEAQEGAIIATYRRRDALAANLANPVARQVVMDGASSALAGSLAAIPLNAHLFSVECGSTAQTDEAAESGTLATPSPSGCDSGPYGISISLVFVSFSVDCEQVTLAAQSLGWVGAFAQVSHKFASGETTVFAGVEAGAKGSVSAVGELLNLLGANATVQDGVYVTADSTGALEDAGVRATAGIQANAGPITISRSSQVSYSFFGAIPRSALPEPSSE